MLGIFFAIVFAITTPAQPLSPLTPDVIWVKVDEYSDLSDREEKARLDRVFIPEVQHDPESIVYVVAWAGRVSCEGEAQKRANRVKDYLIKVGKIDAKRIRIIDVGFQKEWMISLYIAPTSAPPLTKEILSQSHWDLKPAEVSISGNCKKFPALASE